MTHVNWQRSTLMPLLFLVLTAAGFCLQVSSVKADPAGGMKINALYDIRFNGISIGDFKFSSSLSSREYDMDAQASISLIGGMLFDWKGSTQSRGTITANGPKPGNYNFSYRTSDKKEQVSLRFTNNVVTEVSLNPPRGQSGRRIPITQSHLQNVVDPLSALVMLSQARTQAQKNAPCTRRLPIFDGKLRYDLIFSYKEKSQIDEGGYKGPVHICRVRYEQIAGHKPGKDDETLTQANDKIEVWLIPLPEAELFVPYKISVPTPAGTASMVTRKFNFTLPSQVKRTLID